MARAFARLTFVCLALIMAVPVSPAGAQQAAQQAVSIEMGSPGVSGSFSGTFTFSDVADQGGQTLAQGILTGTLQTARGPVSVVKPAALPMNALNDPNALASLVTDLLAAFAR